MIQNGRIQEEADEDTEEPAQKVKSLTPQEKAIYLEVDALQVELGTIIMKVSSAGTYTYDTARAKQHKDRYSALAMAVRYIAELEDARKRRLTGGYLGAVGVVTYM